MKPASVLAGREVILSFGLLGPGKGYELAIDALPAVVAAHPTALYVIVGATHPDLIASEGEAYRARSWPGSASSGWGPRPFRRQVRRPRRADPLAAGRGRLRHALPEPRPDRLRARSPTRWAPAGRSSRPRIRTPRSSSPMAAACSSHPVPRRCSRPPSMRSSATATWIGHRAPRVRPLAADGLVGGGGGVPAGARRSCHRRTPL